MDNKRCEITVALYGDTSDCSTVPDAITLASPQYFVEALALRDAHNEESGWRYPVILRFEECDVFIEYNAASLQACTYPGDAYEFAKSRYTASGNLERTFYLSRVEAANVCAGEFFIGLENSSDREDGLSLYLENHIVVIS